MVLFIFSIFSNYCLYVWVCVKGVDELIKAHKLACLRITCVYVCKDTLWIGTSAGLIINVKIPHVNNATHKLNSALTFTGKPLSNQTLVFIFTSYECEITDQRFFLFLFLCSSNSAKPWPHGTGALYYEFRSAQKSAGLEQHRSVLVNARHNRNYHIVICIHILLLIIINSSSSSSSSNIIIVCRCSHYWRQRLAVHGSSGGE